jgi:hypothetical protein
MGGTSLDALPDLFDLEAVRERTVKSMCNYSAR